MQQHYKNGIEIQTIEIPNAELIPVIVQQLEEGDTVTLPLRGRSMRPFLEDGRDKALLDKPKANPQVGDPVLAEIYPKHYVLHRIVKIEGDNVTLLGDGNLSPEHCKLSDIRASVTGFYRKGSNTLDRTDGEKWIKYSKVWMKLRPIRRWLLAIYRRLPSLCRSLPIIRNYI